MYLFFFLMPEFTAINESIMYFLLVIVDSDPGGNTCHKALFNIGGTTTTSRSWTIRVTQYACGDTDMSGYEFTIHQFTYSRVWNRRRAGNNHRAWKTCQKE